MDVLWADAEIEDVSLDYDAVRLRLRESTGQTVVVTGDGPLGIELAGLWDEIVVERSELVADDEFARRCWQAIQTRLAHRVPDSGSPARNTRSFETLVITLIDGAVLRVTAASFTTRRATAS